MSSIFGLDIGATTIKVLQLKKSGSRVALESIAVGQAPQKGILSEAPADLQNFADAVIRVVKSAKINTKDVNIALPESQVYTKILEMPAMSEKELVTALKYEMEQYIPLPLDQVQTDWEILDTGEANNKTRRVLLVAAPIKLIQKYETVMEMTGLNPVAIETEIIAVHRAMLPLISGQNPSMIIHMGATKTNIAIVKNGQLLMVFSVDKGGIAITRAVAIDLGMDNAQADAYKKAYGLSQQAFEGKVGKSLAPILESILGDVRKALLLFKDKNADEQVTQVILSGGTSQLPGIDVYFANQLNIQVVLGNAFQLYGINDIPQEISADSQSFNVVAGLALKDDM